MFCKFCGSELPENANFCTTCGKINEDDIPAAPAQNPTPNYQQSYQQPAQPYQQPAQPYQPYQQPAQPYQQPAQPYQPYQQPAQPYQQPAYQQPVQPYQQPTYAYPDANNPYQLEKDDLGGSILKFGILGLVFANTFFLSFLGLIFSIIGRRKLSEYNEKFGETEGRATVGKILSLIGLIMSIVLTVIFAIYMFALVVSILMII